MSLYRNRTAALLAIFAIALQALWPLLAQAKPTVPGERVPVCTIEGITHYVELPATDTPVEKRSSAHHEHCKMCVFGAEKVAALPAAAPLVAPVTGEERSLDSVSAVSSSSSFPKPAFPRAPPIAS